VGDVTALDPEAVAVEHARLRVTSDVRFLVGGVDDVLDDLAPPYDAAVCINVLEHIRDDEGTLRTIHALLRPGGTLLLLVPAGPWLYGSLDRAFGHERRYRRAELARLLERTGFRHDGVPSFNMLGIPGWFAAAKMLGHTELRPGLLGVYRVLAPPFRWFEDRFGAPVGLSLFTVAVRS
jgi:SAM-dependent methyltransferase